MKLTFSSITIPLHLACVIISLVLIKHGPQVFTNAGVLAGKFGGTPLVYDSRIGDKAQTSQILCESELKLQSSLVSKGRSESPLDYWARAITAQNVPGTQLDTRGLKITLSSYVVLGVRNSNLKP